MLPLLAASAGIGAIGNLAGAYMADSSAKNAANVQKGAAQNALMGQWQQRQLQDQYGRPYADMGLDYLPYLDYMTTGRMPDQVAFGDAEQAELAGLMGQYDELQRQRNMYTSSSTGNRSNQRMYAGIVTGIDEKLARLSELQNQQRQANAYGQIQGGNLLQESPLYKWQQEQGAQRINRDMAARNMYGSSAATNQLARFQNQLGAEESERQYGRVAGMVNMGMGQGNTYAANQGNTANTAGNISLNIGNSLADNTMQRGNNMASLYQSIGQAPMQAMGAYNNMQTANALQGYYNRGNSVPSAIF
jgi:hypothetical protein